MFGIIAIILILWALIKNSNYKWNVNYEHKQEAIKKGEKYYIGDNYGWKRVEDDVNVWFQQEITEDNQITGDVLEVEFNTGRKKNRSEIERQERHEEIMNDPRRTVYPIGSKLGQYNSMKEAKGFRYVDKKNGNVYVIRCPYPEHYDYFMDIHSGKYIRFTDSHVNKFGKQVEQKHLDWINKSRNTKNMCDYQGGISQYSIDNYFDNNKAKMFDDEQHYFDRVDKEMEKFNED